MNELQAKSTGKRKNPTRNTENLNSDSFFDGFLVEQEKNLNSFQFKMVFADESKETTTADFTCSEKTNSKSVVMWLVSSLIKSGWLKKSDLQSEILKGSAGRSKLEVDLSTGKVKGKMKTLNRQVVELWNEGKEVEEIAKTLRPRLKNKRKSDFITKIRRILLTNGRLLTHPYVQKIEKLDDIKLIS